jgi:hypothetical protein
MGLLGDTNRVKINGNPQAEVTWEHGKGKELARSLLGGREKRQSQEHLFRIGDDQVEDSDSDST